MSSVELHAKVLDAGLGMLFSALNPPQPERIYFTKEANDIFGRCTCDDSGLCSWCRCNEYGPEFAISTSVAEGVR